MLISNCITSLPVRGAWIEMLSQIYSLPSQSSLPVRGAWIEIVPRPSVTPCSPWSLPVRGAWIEMEVGVDSEVEVQVAPRAGSVD